MAHGPSRHLPVNIETAGVQNLAVILGRVVVIRLHFGVGLFLAFDWGEHTFEPWVFVWFIITLRAGVTTRLKGANWRNTEEICINMSVYCMIGNEVLCRHYLFVSHFIVRMERIEHV